VEEGELFAKRAGSFGSHAADYAEHRPDYPADGIRWALSGATRPVRRVLDLAAGTGKLAGGLLALGLEVIAVEPDGSMLAELSRRVPRASALAGTAERIPLARGTVDAVLAGQAFHWFDGERALTEIARVLRPGGVLGALWNESDVRVDWVVELDGLGRTSASWNRRYNEDLIAHPAFDPFEKAVFDHTQRRTADSLTATIGTHSHTLVISAAERAELLDRVRRYLRERPETAHGEFDLPIRTTVIRARRRDQVP
jgi:SAM-dependent methyltransferase